MDDTTEAPEPQDTSSEAELIQNRFQNLNQIASLVGNVYPFGFPLDATPSDVNERFGSKTGDGLERERAEVSTAGRILAQRHQGKAGFLDLSDGKQRIQVYVRKDAVEESAWTLFKALDLGDWIGVKGEVFRTRTGQLSVKAKEIAFLAKCLRPLPEKWHGLRDVERRYRQRYLDLAVNPESRRVFEVRAAIVKAIRRFLDARGYLEVETPMMQAIPGGALARNFRNEGISTQHNPEFTMLEFYEAYSRASDLMALTEEMLFELVREVAGGTTTKWGDASIDWSPPFRKVTMRQAVLEATREDARGPVRPEELETAEGLLAAARRLGVEAAERFAGKKGKLLAELFEAVAEARFVQPTFLTEFPTEISPLSKQDPGAPEWVDRFELYAGGMEIANGFSELNDPAEQERRFREQARERTGGDLEAMAFDHDYLEALSYGMPPTAGEGVGIDRLTMLLTDSHSIRDVILFPLLRPRHDVKEAEEAVRRGEQKRTGP